MAGWQVARWREADRLGGWVPGGWEIGGWKAGTLAGWETGKPAGLGAQWLGGWAHHAGLSERDSRSPGQRLEQLLGAEVPELQLLIDTPRASQDSVAILRGNRVAIRNRQLAIGNTQLAVGNRQ